MTLPDPMRAICSPGLATFGSVPRFNESQHFYRFVSDDDKVPCRSAPFHAGRVPASRQLAEHWDGTSWNFVPTPSFGPGAGMVTQDNLCKDVAGTVLTQNPAGGSQARRGSAVNLTVSSGVTSTGKPSVFN
jgi:PASTA domain-containing protein